MFTDRPKPKAPWFFGVWDFLFMLAEEGVTVLKTKDGPSLSCPRHHTKESFREWLAPFTGYLAQYRAEIIGIHETLESDYFARPFAELSPGRQRTFLFGRITERARAADGRVCGFCRYNASTAYLAPDAETFPAVWTFAEVQWTPPLLGTLCRGMGHELPAAALPKNYKPPKEPTLRQKRSEWYKRAWGVSPTFKDSMPPD